MNVIQVPRTQGIHSYSLATVHFTAVPNRDCFMKKSSPHFGLIYKYPTFQLVSEFYTTYERIKDKAYRGILAVVKIKTKGIN